MKTGIIKKFVSLSAFLLILSCGAYAQSGNLIVDILDALLDDDSADHKYINAGDQAHFMVPKNILGSAHGDWYQWSTEYDKVRIVSTSRDGITVRGVKSTSATIVKYRYKVKVIRDGKEHEEEMSYPFTLTIRRVEPTSLTINQETTVGWGTRCSLATVLYPEYSEAGLTYTSSNPDIVSVDSYGTLTGNALGEADVFIKSDNALEASTHVVVGIPAVSEIRITGFDSRIKVYPGDTMRLGFQYAPEHADPSVSWISTDSHVATVDQSGLVTFLEAGTVKIICQDIDGAEGSVRIKCRKSK